MARLSGSLRLFSSLLFRLCLFMVAAFGSRPCGVAGIEQTKAPLIVGLRAHHVADADARAYDPASPSLGSPARSVVALRGPTLAPVGGASPSALESVLSANTLAVATAAAAPLARRTPCAACGDGKPYDATAPPRSDMA